MNFASGDSNSGFVCAFGNANPDFYEKYSVYDLLCMYWAFSQQLDCYRIIDDSKFNEH